MEHGIINPCPCLQYSGLGVEGTRVPATKPPAILTLSDIHDHRQNSINQNVGRSRGHGWICGTYHLIMITQCHEWQQQRVCTTVYLYNAVAEVHAISESHHYA